MNALRVALPLVLLAGGCTSAAAPVGRPMDPPPSRASWADRLRDIFACRSYAQVTGFLDRLRELPPRTPRSAGGGCYQRGSQALVFDDLFPLDDTFSLYLVWNGRDPSQGIRSVEIVGFQDLRPRIPPDLYDAVLAVHRSPTAVQPWSIDPVLLVRAVNTLQPLGARARLALTAYLDLARGLSFEEQRKHAVDVSRILPVVQLLGTSPAAFGLGPGGLGDPGPALWPLFPLTLEQGLPFLVEPQDLPGASPEEVLHRLGPGFTVRSSLLVPTGNPVEAAETLFHSPRWTALLEVSEPGHPRQSVRGAKELRMLVRSQALEALAPVYRPPEDFIPKNCCEDPSEGAWREVVEQVRALGIRWDPERQDFVRPP